MTESSMTALARPVVLASFLSLILILPAPVARAEDAPTWDTKVVLDPFPLRPPDTSSPRDTLRGHPKVNPAPARVRFVGYGAYSKDLEVFAYPDCQDQDTFLAIQEDLLLRMEDIVNEAGSGFAFPSQTAYLSQDKGLDGERRREAEAQVRQWRDSGRLPFPEFEDNEREQLKDTLDCSPKGSPYYGPPGA